MCKFSSKSGGVPFQISFFLGDLTRNDPIVRTEHTNPLPRDDNCAGHIVDKTSCMQQHCNAINIQHPMLILCNN